MKESEAQRLEAAVFFLRARARQQYKAVLLMVISLFVIFILPNFIPSPFGGMVIGLGGAGIFTIYVLQNPNSFRSRKGSLIPAICLATALWLSAAVVVILSLKGRIG